MANSIHSEKFFNQNEITQLSVQHLLNFQRGLFTKIRYMRGYSIKRMASFLKYKYNDYSRQTIRL